MKNLRRMLSVMFVLLFSCILFVGCGGEQGIDETRQYVIFTVSKDSPGKPTEEDTYKVDSDALKEVQYEYDPEVTYSIRADVYYVENDEPTGAYKRGDYYVRKGDDIGETTMYMEFCYNGKYTDAGFTLEVIRTPVTPEVRFDPNGAISYVENESYTYEYDGKFHYPLIRLSYNNEEIKLKDKCDKYLSCRREEWEYQSTSSIKDHPYYAGTYLLTYRVNDDDFVDEEDSEKFVISDITIKVIILDLRSAIVTPEVSFDPNGAMSYVENESYTYEYDDDFHYPRIQLSYNNEKIEIKNGMDGYLSCHRIGNDGEPTFFEEEPCNLGVYLLRYIISPDDLVKDQDRERFSLLTISIKVTIVEKSN